MSQSDKYCPDGMGGFRAGKTSIDELALNIRSGLSSAPSPQFGDTLVATAHPIRHKVLVVEDDAGLRTLYADALHRQGFQIRTAEDGVSALRALEFFEPDVVVLDLRLPLADGFDVVRELRRDVTRAHLPIIAVSGYDHGLAAARQDPEFFAALQKPFDTDDLIDVVRRATARPRPELL